MKIKTNRNKLLILPVIILIFMFLMSGCQGKTAETSAAAGSVTTTTIEENNASSTTLVETTTTQNPYKVKYPVTVQKSDSKIIFVDDAERTIELDKPLSRVVVFNQMNSEIIRALGKGSAIIGVDANTLQSPSYWPEIDPKAVVGKSQTALDYEKIVQMNPEAVVLPINGSYEEAIKKLTPFGIKVVVVTCWKNANFVKQVEILGKAFDVKENADEFISFCQAPLSLISERLKGAKRKTVYLENNGEYKTCLVGSGWNDMIVSAGGENIFGDIVFANEDSSKGSVHSFDIDPEKILVKNPDILVQLVYSTQANKGTSTYTQIKDSEMQDVLSKFVKRPGWDNLDAVKNKQVFGLSSFAGNACFKIVGSCYIAKWLYPELFKDLGADAFFAKWLEKYQGVKALNGGNAHQLQ
ncbi:MAG: ABC transporter substrate-binding protein [Candidatus Humimicrobiaceae bacterium]